MPRPPLPFRLRSQDAKEVERLLRGGVQQIRVVRALVVRHLGQGLSAPQVARLVPLTPQAVRKVAHRYRQGGLTRALFDGPRPGAAEVLGPSDKCHFSPDSSPVVFAIGGQAFSPDGGHPFSPDRGPGVFAR